MSTEKKNKAADDALAEQALGREIGFYSFLQPPDYVLNLIHDDLEGLTRSE